MGKLVPYVIVLILSVFARITLSHDSSSSYYSWNYGDVSSNDVDASSRGYESPASEENQYDTPPWSEGDGHSTNTYYESQYAYPPNAGADNLSTADEVTYASPPIMSSAPSSLETMPNNSDETYKGELSSSSSYDDSSNPLSDSSPSSSYEDSSTPQSDSSSSSSYDDSSSSSGNSSSSSSSSSNWEEDSSPTTTDESQLGTEDRNNSVEEVGSGVVGTEMKMEHSGSKAGLVFGVLIGVCAVGAAGFIFIKKKRENYPNTNRYISLTRWTRFDRSSDNM